MKRVKTLTSYFALAPTPIIQFNQPRTEEIELEPERETVEVGASNVKLTSPHVISNGIVADPCLRIPDEEFGPNIMDASKKEHIIF